MQLCELDDRDKEMGGGGGGGGGHRPPRSPLKIATGKDDHVGTFSLYKTLLEIY